MDLEKLSYISSAGLRALLTIAKNLMGRGAKLALCAMSDQIREVFAISGFDKIIPIHRPKPRRLLPSIPDPRETGIPQYFAYHAGSSRNGGRCRWNSGGR